MSAQAVQDRIEILELSARYNRAADETDGEAVMSVFTSDGIVEMLGPGNERSVYAGPELVKLAAPFAGQRVHLTTDALVEVDGDRASQRSSLLLITRSRRRSLAAVFTGRYDDQLIRTSSGWRFARRQVFVDYANEAQMPLAGSAN